MSDKPADKLTFRTDMDFAYGVPKDLAPGVTRLVANNPSPFTYKGTNSYLIGTTSAGVDRSWAARSRASASDPRGRQPAGRSPTF